MKNSTQQRSAEYICRRCNGRETPHQRPLRTLLTEMADVLTCYEHWPDTIMIVSDSAYSKIANWSLYAARQQCSNNAGGGGVRTWPAVRAKEARLACDTEFIRERTYAPALEVVPVATSGRAFGRAGFGNSRRASRPSALP